MFKNCILFPNKLGQKKFGVDYTPFFFKNRLFNLHKIYDVKIVNDININLYNLYKTNRNISGSRINIGGDHSMSIATIQDSLIRYNDLKVIWIDAHADINTFKSSNSKNIHGMPLSFLTGLDRGVINFNDKRLDFKNLMYIGLRDTDQYEKEVIEKNNINYITSDMVNNNLADSLLKLNNFIGSSYVHMSFDVDVLDPKVMPCTGTPVNNGLELKVCRALIKFLMNKNIVSCDLTELNLLLGDLNDKELSIKNIEYLFNKYLYFK